MTSMANVITIDFVLNRQLHRRIDVAAFFVTAHVQVLVIGPVIGKPMNQPGIAVEVENDRLIDGKQAVEVAIAQTVRMIALCLQLEQIDTLMKRIFTSGNSARSSAVAASASWVGISPAHAITTSGSVP